MWSRPGAAIAAVLGTIAIVLACHLTHVPWWAPAGAGLGLATFTLPGLLAGLNTARWAFTALCLAVAGGYGSWATWAVGYSSITPLLVVALPVLGGGLAALSLLLPPAAPTHVRHSEVKTAEVADHRPERVRWWEALLRRLTKQPITVTDCTDWDNGAGERVDVLLPEGFTTRQLADLTDTIASAPALRLPQGCTIQVLDGPWRCSAILDVMRRDVLADEVLIDEPTTPASITDEVRLMTSPRGDGLSACLRERSMVVGGAEGSGKTTFLHRLVFFLARCLDVVIWIIDLNGGGVAEPWITPWAVGQAKRPIIDWVADNEAEAAVMVATGLAIARDRKTSPEARRRRRAANTTVLPVDHHLPAILILIDEGGEIQQGRNLLAALVAEGIARIAQIGRAEGLRLVLSVLRGTSDLLAKGFRVVAGIRVCLRMNEEGEVDHVLATNPGRARLIHTGSGWLLRPTDHRPLLARTVNVTLDDIDRHAIACASHRPSLDQRAQQVAARVSVRDVLGGKNPADHRDLARLRPLRDVADGRGYAGRWDRYAAKLAEMRGEEPLPEPDDDEQGTPSSAVAPGSALEALASRTGVLDLDPVGPERPAASTEDTIVEIVRHSHPMPVTSAQIGEGLVAVGAGVARQYRQDLLSKLVDASRLARGETFGTYVLGSREARSVSEAV